MKLYLARHGWTNYNDLRLCNADPTVDVHLTPTGVSQAEALADKLKQTALDHIIVSELKRTQQTAEIVNRFHHLEIEVDASRYRVTRRYAEREQPHELPPLLERDGVPLSQDDANGEPLTRWSSACSQGDGLNTGKLKMSRGAPLAAAAPQVTRPS